MTLFSFNFAHKWCFLCIFNCFMQRCK